MALLEVSGEARIVGAPKLEFTPSGTAVMEARVVNSGRRQNKQTQEWEDIDTSWFTLKIWGALAENAGQFLKDKDVVTFTGQMTVRSYDKQDGSKGQTTEIKVRTIGIAVPSKPTGAVQQQGQPQQGQQPMDNSNPFGAPAQQPYGQQPQQPIQQQPYGQPQGQPQYAQQPVQQQQYAQPQGQPVQQQMQQQPVQQQAPQQPWPNQQQGEAPF